MERTTVVFICIGNTCRSPMAEAMARAMGGDAIRALSAGLASTGHVAPQTLATLEALGYSGEGLASKGLSQVPLDEVDLVVSLIGSPGVRWIPHGMPVETVVWSLPDPWGEDEATYLAVARRIEALVRDLVDDLIAT
ncbi:MAG: low molecular weight phosphatase family protein [Acidobacteria bacterium]|nr:low molecular weight phosphatase family protein [Acidobacteriota bacterium]